MKEKTVSGSKLQNVYRVDKTGMSQWSMAPWLRDRLNGKVLKD